MKTKMPTSNKPGWPAWPTKRPARQVAVIPVLSDDGPATGDTHQSVHSVLNVFSAPHPCHPYCDANGFNRDRHRMAFGRCKFGLPKKEVRPSSIKSKKVDDWMPPQGRRFSAVHAITLSCSFAQAFDDRQQSQLGRPNAWNPMSRRNNLRIKKTPI